MQDTALTEVEEILTCEVSDEALESVVRFGDDRTSNLTFYFCTALDLCPAP
jgi:hypothetical protein